MEIKREGKVFGGDSVAVRPISVKMAVQDIAPLESL